MTRQDYELTLEAAEDSLNEFVLGIVNRISSLYSEADGILDAHGINSESVRQYLFEEAGIKILEALDDAADDFNTDLDPVHLLARRYRVFPYGPKSERM